jgi:hypothetical protein
MRELVDDAGRPAVLFQYSRAGALHTIAQADPGTRWIVDMQQGRAEIEAVRTIAPIDPDDRNLRRSQGRQQAGKGRDRGAGRRDVDADRSQPAVWMTKVVLHVDHDHRRAGEIDDAVLGLGLQPGGHCRGWLAHQVGLPAAHPPGVAFAWSEHDRLDIFRHASSPIEGHFLLRAIAA